MMDFFGKAIVSASAFCGGTEPVVRTSQESTLSSSLRRLFEKKPAYGMGHNCLGIAVCH